MTATQTWLDVLSTEEFRGIPDVYSNVSAAIQPQYAHAQRMGNLCAMFQDEIDATKQLVDILTTSDVDKAEGAFLDWLGQRAGVSRVVTYQSETVQLDDILFRELVRWALARNLTTSDLRALNVMIKKLIGIAAPIQKSGTMSLYLQVKEEVSGASLVLLRNFLTEISPAGVGINFSTDYESVLGFNGQDLSTFNFGVFNPTTLS